MNAGKVPPSRWIHRAAAWLGETAHLMVGIPDYERYVAHCRNAHPDQPVMDRMRFFRERQERRYAGCGAGRCC